MIYVDMESLDTKWKYWGGDLLYVKYNYKSNFIISQYAETLCEIKKGVERTLSFLYREFAHKEYSQLPFNKGEEGWVHEIYLNIITSHLHKSMAYLAVFPLLEAIKPMA